MVKYFDIANLLLNAQSSYQIIFRTQPEDVFRRDRSKAERAALPTDSDLSMATPTISGL